MVNWQTTIADLLKMGISKVQFKKITGYDLPDNKNITLRDFIAGKGIPFKDVKEKITEILEKK